MPRVVIIGGGISGLALAYRLQQSTPSVDVTLLERTNRLGGTVGTLHEDGYQIEVGPNGFLDNKPSTLALCKDLGLADHLLPASEAAGRNRFVFLNKKLRRLPTGPGEFLSTGVLSWRGKFNVVMERFRSRSADTGDESISRFFERRLGREIAGGLADAFVTGIYAGDPSLLSMRACFPRLVAMEEEHGSLIKGMAANARKRRKEAKTAGRPARASVQMWSLRSGLNQLVDSLDSKLDESPTLGVEVQQLERPSSPNSTWIVRGNASQQWQANAVVLACPSHEQASLLAEVDPGIAEDIGKIAYNRVAVVALGYRRADVPGTLNGFGYLVPQAERRNLLGVQWCSSIFPDRAPPGMVLLRAMCGGWHRGDMVDWDDARLLQAVADELGQAMGIEAKPLFHWIIRWPRAIPQYFLGHLDRVVRIEERLAKYPGLFVSGNAYRGVSLNDCTEQADLAKRVHGYLMATRVGD
ncbi:MAG: protoporphyrinogen oxidase [Gemmataceae bacterium]